MATADASGGPPTGSSPEKSNASAGQPGRSGGGGGAADSYIGSLISLTSKSEIRYEGVLYTINTEESSIGLRNVRSFGTEGRKKDGPQIPASDKIYEYILFRGSDIKDLQVKAPVQPAQPVQPTSIHNDPAIIQSHYTRPTPPSTASLPSAFPTGPTQDPSQFNTGGLQQRPPQFQTNIPPIYQPNPALPSWGPQPNQPPPPNNGPGMSLPPVYWQGYYPPPPNGGFQLPQNHTLLRPPHAMPLQYPSPSLTQNIPPMNLPELPLLLQQQHPGNANTSTTGTVTGMSNFTSVPLGTEAAPSLIPNRPGIPSSLPGFPSPSLAASLSLGFNTEPSASTASLSSNRLLVPVSVPTTLEPTLPLLNPGQFLQNSQTMPLSVPISSSVPVQNSPKEPEILTTNENDLLSSDPIFAEIKAVETKKIESKKDEPILPEPVLHAPVDNKEPLLPSPAPGQYKSGGGHSYNHHNYNNNNNYRGRGRGRGPSAFSRQATKFTEEFDFIAMNEKFNKDEVWGHLGKNKDENDAEDSLEDFESDAPKPDVKPVYVKDDFFDSLSCTSLDQNSRNGRPRFSEQLKLDTETFGSFQRQQYRPMGMRGGGRGPRGGYNNNGYNNNGYSNRGGGRGVSYYNNRGGYGYNNHNNNGNPGRGTRGPVYTNHASSS